MPSFTSFMEMLILCDCHIKMINRFVIMLPVLLIKDLTFLKNKSQTFLGNESIIGNANIMANEAMKSSLKKWE